MKQKINNKRIITLSRATWVCSLVMAFVWFINLGEAFDEVDRTNGIGNIFEGVYLLAISVALAVTAIYLKIKKGQDDGK
jgi:hypothetical protein